MKKLKDREPLKITLFGDSISAGGNASGVTGAKPFMPAFGELVVNELHKIYGSEITYRNHSVGGTASGWGLRILQLSQMKNPIW